IKPLLETSISQGTVSLSRTIKTWSFALRLKDSLEGGHPCLEGVGGTRFDLNRLAPTGRDACPPGIGGDLRPLCETRNSLRFNAMAIPKANWSGDWALLCRPGRCGLAAAPPQTGLHGVT